MHVGLKVVRETKIDTTLAVIDYRVVVSCSKAMSETIKQGVKSGPNHGSRNGVLKEKRILVCVIYNNRSIL